jgi:hypothetical protein
MWKYFDRGDNKREAICKTCSTVVPFIRPSMAEMAVHIVS